MSQRALEFCLAISTTAKLQGCAIERAHVRANMLIMNRQEGKELQRSFKLAGGPFQASPTRLTSSLPWSQISS